MLLVNFKILVAMNYRGNNLKVKQALEKRDYICGHIFPVNFVFAFLIYLHKELKPYLLRFLHT